MRKKLSTLKVSQIEYETTKHDVRRLEEELELRKLQIDEFVQLKNINEKEINFIIKKKKKEKIC